MGAPPDGGQGAQQLPHPQHRRRPHPQAPAAVTGTSIYLFIYREPPWSFDAEGLPPLRLACKTLARQAAESMGVDTEEAWAPTVVRPSPCNRISTGFSFDRLPLASFWPPDLAEFFDLWLVLFTNYFLGLHSIHAL